MTSKEYFKNLTIIHLVLLVGQLLFLAVVLYLHFFSEKEHMSEKNELLIYIIPLAAAGGVLASFLSEKSRLKSLIELPELKQKCTGYQQLHITKMAFIEGPVLFAIVGLMLTQNLYLLIVIGILLALFVYHFPSKARLIAQLQLNYQEELEINLGDSIITEKKTGGRGGF